MNLTVEAGTPGEVRHGHPLPAALLHGVVTRTFRIGLADAVLAAGDPSGCHAALREVLERHAPEPDAVYPPPPEEAR